MKPGTLIRKLFFLFLSILIFNNTKSQSLPDCSGNWLGLLTQPNGALGAEYVIWLELIQEGDEIRGQSIVQTRKGGYYCIMAITGEFSDSISIVINDRAIITQSDLKNTGKKLEWCFKELNLKLSPDSNFLSGKWEGRTTNLGRCTPGEVLVKRTNEQFVISDTAQQDIEQKNPLQDFENAMSKRNSDDTFVMEGITFEQSKSIITKESEINLVKIADLLKKYPETRIRINGHTDNQGDRKANLKLSRERAKAVVDFLIKQGIQKDRFEYQGLGPDYPKASNATEEGRKQNRRVEFQIIKSSK